ncbi:MAG: hypothetical protein II336_20270 [Loktanella sp.]|nr:hypothetical protein [Loktanella sp.]
MLIQNKTAARYPANPVPAARDKTARYLMIALSVATLGAFANAAAEFGSLPPDRLIVGTWQILGFAVFAGLFALLAIWPRRMPGLWELILLHKVGVTLMNIGFIETVSGPMPSDNPTAVVMIDGTLVAITLLAYVLAQGWRPWFTKSAQ